MAIPDNRLSTQTVYDTWLSPDDRLHNLNDDYEMGPIAIGDTSEGLKYQPWHMTYNPITSELIVTPEIVGAPSVALVVNDLSYCWFGFDQNASINVTYKESGVAKMYWYDSFEAKFVHTNLGATVIHSALFLDDKREHENQAADLVLFYTKDQGNGTYNLYHKMQNERFLIEYLYKTDVPPYFTRCGMHNGLRLQIGMRY